MQVMYWQEIADAEADPKLSRLTLHRNQERTSGIHLSLRPISAERRELLVKAVMGRLENSQGAE